MMLLFKMIRRKLKRVGIQGAIIDLFRKIATINNKKSQQVSQEGHSFDEKFGIETTDYVPVSTLDVSDDDFLKAGSYRPTPVSVFEKLMAKLPIDFSKFVFIDFGSGKGRTLLLASQYHFKKIIGVEFSNKLHETARNNILRYKEKSNVACSDIESVYSNAITYALPEEPSIYYFFNPFQFDIMSSVLKNIDQSLRTNHRDAYIVYLKPLHPKSIEGVTGFRRIETMEFAEYSYSCYIYKWEP